MTSQPKPRFIYGGITSGDPVGFAVIDTRKPGSMEILPTRADAETRLDFLNHGITYDKGVTAGWNQVPDDLVDEFKALVDELDAEYEDGVASWAMDQVALWIVQRFVRKPEA